MDEVEYLGVRSVSEFDDGDDENRDLQKALLASLHKRSRDWSDPAKVSRRKKPTQGPVFATRECAICLDAIESSASRGKQCAFLACGHGFHQGCIKIHKRVKGGDAKCPLCNVLIGSL